MSTVPTAVTRRNAVASGPPEHGTAHTLAELARRVRGIESRLERLAGSDAKPAISPPAARPPISHGPDFAAVNWHGAVYAFTPKQRIVVSALWQAMEEGYGWLSQESLLEAAESDCKRLRDLFKLHPAWGTMIICAAAGDGAPGCYRLAEVPEGGAA